MDTGVPSRGLLCHPLGTNLSIFWTLTRGVRGHIIPFIGNKLLKNGQGKRLMVKDLDTSPKLPKKLPPKRPRGTWIQTDRAAHEAWALLAKKPAASAVMHMLCANIGDHNAVVISQKTLAELCGLTVRSVKRGIADLVEGNWIEVRQIGATSQTNAYIVNDRVAWHGKRGSIQYSLFSATIVASSEEQPDKDQLGQQEPLRVLPRIGEEQAPAGDGLPPPSQPDFPGLETDLPAAGYDPETGEIIDE